MSDLRIQLQSFTKNVCDGFVRFQQDGDFVDMTLAAEGHMVKVHKNILAVSSPYIEALLKSIPCKHPVIFLNNMTEQTLSYILEYVYTGVVVVPKDKIDQFALACKQLQIVGLMEYEDAMLDASVKLNRPKKGKKHQTHSTVNKLRSTRTSFYSNHEAKSDRDEETNHSISNIDPTLEEERCTNTVQLSVKNVNRNTISNADRNVINVDNNLKDVENNITDVDRNVDTHNMASDNLNDNILIENKKRKLSSIISGPSDAKQVKVYVSFTQKVNDDSGNNTEHQPKYQIDLSNISTLKDKSICNDSQINDTVVCKRNMSEPVGEKSIDEYISVISNVDDPNNPHSNISVEKNSVCVRPMASLMFNPADGTINITRNKEINTDMEDCDLLTNVVEEPMTHTNTSNDCDITNLIQVNNGLKDNENSAYYTSNTNNGTPISELPVNIESKNISNRTANTLVLDKNTGHIVPVSQTSETIDNGDSNNVVNISKYYQDQFQHHIGFQNNSGSSFSEYRSKILEDAKPLYTLSKRGSLQMILNRFAYGIVYVSSTNKRRRWRCIQYRELHCPAAAETVDEDIVKRSFEHTHPFHDSQILRKGQKDAVFAKMSQAFKYANALQKEPPGIRNLEEYKRDLAMLIVKEDELNCMFKE